MELVSNVVLSIRQDIERLEKNICILEDSDNFNSENPRYKRYINEKIDLRSHLFQLLTACVPSENKDKADLVHNNKSEIKDSTVAAGPDRTSPSKQHQEVKQEDEDHTTSSNEPSTNDFKSNSMKRKLDSQMAFTSQKTLVNEHNASELREYHEDKLKIAQLMRDFSNRFIVFLSATDDSQITVEQYIPISRHVRTHPTDRLADYLKGVTKVYKLNTNHQKGTCTENKLFIPDFHAL